jgi:hypothetical protein
MAYSVDSLEGRASLVRRAYEQKAALGVGVPGPWVEEVFDDYAVVCREGKYYRIPYTIAGTEVSFGEPEEVKVEYATVTEALEALTPKGKKWEVRLIREGVSKKGWIYTKKALESLLPFISGAKLRAVETVDGVYAHNGRAAVIGKLAAPNAVEVDGFYEPRAEAEIEDSRRDWLLGEMKAGRVNGVSINAPVEGVKLANGQVWVKRFLGLEALDLATIPSAGGEFLRATESVAREGIMNLEQILALLKKHKREDLLTKLGATPTIEQAQEALEAALETALTPAAPGNGNGADARVLTAQEAQELRAAIEQSKKDSSAAYLTLKLSEASLPAPVKKKLEKQFSGVVFAREALDQAITAEKEMLDALMPSTGVVVGAGETRVVIAREAVDKIQAALDKTFGVKVTGHDDIRPFRGLMHAYAQITGKSEFRDFEIRGYRAEEAITSADFTALIDRTLNRRLTQDYNEIDYEEGRLISLRGSAVDFKLQEANRVGYYADPPIVDPETDDYLEAAKPGEESVTYKIQTRGELVKITRVIMRNDDLGAITKRINGRARAYRRGHARFVWSFYISNKNYKHDGVAWFAVGHGNLKTEAIAAAEIADAVTKLMAMTEPSSGEKIGLDRAMKKRLSLVVADTMWDKAKKINERQYLDAAFDPNPVYKLFGENNENIVELPLDADADNWGVLCNPADREIVEMKYLDGRTEPEMFLADQPTVGEMLVRDTLVYKDRFEYGGELVDFRNGVKSVVP